MNIFSGILCILITAVALSGCADGTNTPFNSPDQQKARADKAQGELSSETK